MGEKRCNFLELSRQGNAEMVQYLDTSMAFRALEKARRSDRFGAFHERDQRLAHRAQRGLELGRTAWARRQALPYRQLGEGWE